MLKYIKERGYFVSVQEHKFLDTDTNTYWMFTIYKDCEEDSYISILDGEYETFDVFPNGDKNPIDYFENYLAPTEEEWIAFKLEHNLE